MPKIGKQMLTGPHLRILRAMAEGPLRIGDVAEQAELETEAWAAKYLKDLTRWGLIEAEQVDVRGDLGVVEVSDVWYGITEAGRLRCQG